MKRLLFVLISSLLLTLTACAKKTPDMLTLYANQTESQIFNDGQQAMLKHNYRDAVSHFEVIGSRYPFGRYAEKSQVNAIYCYYKSDDIPSSLAAIDQYMHVYPRGQYAAYVYYMKGLMHLQENRGFFERYFPYDPATRDLTGVKQAYMDFAQVVRYFPTSKYAPDSKQRMIYIFNMLARHELKVTEYYYEKGSYVAAVNRASDIVKHYQRSTSVPKALALMEKSYRKLGLTREADNVQRVLQANTSHINIS